MEKTRCRVCGNLRFCLRRGGAHQCLTCALGGTSFLLGGFDDGIRALGEVVRTHIRVGSFSPSTRRCVVCGQTGAIDMPCYWKNVCVSCIADTLDSHLESAQLDLKSVLQTCAKCYEPAAYLWELPLCGSCAASAGMKVPQGTSSASGKAQEVVEIPKKAKCVSCSDLRYCLKRNNTPQCLACALLDISFFWVELLSDFGAFWYESHRARASSTRRCNICDHAGALSLPRWGNVCVLCVSRTLMARLESIRREIRAILQTCTSCGRGASHLWAHRLPLCECCVESAELTA